MSQSKKTQVSEEPLERQKALESELKKSSASSAGDLCKKFSSSDLGLSSEQAGKALGTYGKNKITSRVKNTFWDRLKDAFINPFNMILCVIGIVTLVVDRWFDGDPAMDYFTDSIVFILILISGIIAYVQNTSSKNAADKLSKMVSRNAHVYRNGQVTETPIEDIVPGDVVKLSSGDMIPADIRFLTTKDTFVAQAALTGESQPIEKFNSAQDVSDKGVTDLDNIGFMGSNIVSGSATGMVVATGNDTFFGSISESLDTKTQNSFERGVNSVSKLLINNMMIMVPIVFLIILIKSFVAPSGATWVDALLFSIAVAIGITPEMLPVIMTSTLTKGAVEMTKNEVIVKKLSSIQTFGEMDILCTDKTGTLTEDRIVLEKYMDINGDSNMRILNHAYLVSHFQTGLKNLMDVAIINRAEVEGIQNSVKDHKIIDEVPFDFMRRRMSVVLEDDTGFKRLLTKGAVEEVVSISTHIEHDGEVTVLDDEHRKIAMATYEKYNNSGLRMIAVAQKLNVSGAEEFDVEDEKEMTLLGFIGFLDPPKESSKVAIEALKTHGVRTVVLTGDSEGVAVKVCEKVGIKTEGRITGKEIESMDEETLLNRVDNCDLYSKLTPSQKERVVKAYQKKGHTVGYMGDGINDAPSMHTADVGISVDSAVDIAKETAGIILLKKDLMVLEKGVLEGRKIFGNIIKYIKMAASGNFGNTISIVVASLFLPFLPMIPLQLLFLNLLLDFSQLGLPFDRMDSDYLKKPRRWETKSIKTFMYFMGVVSSIFDILCFAVLWFIIGANTQHLSPLFQCGWFLFGGLSQVLVLHIIRTSKIPFLQSNAAIPVVFSTSAVAAVITVLGFTNWAGVLKMTSMSATFVWWLIGLLLAYFITAEIGKKIYVKYFGEWI